ASVENPEVVAISTPEPTTPVTAAAETEEPLSLQSTASNTVIGTNARILDIIDQIEVRGLMGDGRKVLLFFRDTGRTQAFDVGSVINNEWQIRISGVADNPRRVVFEDNAGAIYTKQF
ncbi:MAG: hypothetical protein LR015_13950, partial [Verrucomicrobia bacterium]|nr:hypothetical protein [Verrucomicrobiota bacterium]